MNGPVPPIINHADLTGPVTGDGLAEQIERAGNQLIATTINTMTAELVRLRAETEPLRGLLVLVGYYFDRLAHARTVEDSLTPDEAAKGEVMYHADAAVDRALKALFDHYAAIVGQAQGGE